MMIRPSGGDHEPSTTSGTIAVVNLHAQIDGLAVPSLLLIDLLLQRGHVLGRIADYERAADLAAQLVRDTPGDGTGWLAKARTQAAFHRFTEALADLDAAGRNGLDRPTLAGERAVILQATGRYAQARDLHRRAAVRQPRFTVLSTLAVLHAERGEIAEAERLFTQTRHNYRGTSPFPLASLDYRRGLMWYRLGDLATARTYFDAAWHRVPAYAPALGRLAEIDAAQGAHQAAIDRLHPLARSSDDPEYAAQLARALTAAGHRQEAGRWQASAAARYDELALCHPEAYASHAADFRRQAGWLGPNLAIRSASQPALIRVAPTNADQHRTALGIELA